MISKNLNIKVKSRILKKIGKSRIKQKKRKPSNEKQEEQQKLKMVHLSPNVPSHVHER